MDCNILNTNINACGSTIVARHYKEKGYITSFENLQNVVITGHHVKFLGGEWYEVTDLRSQPFNGTNMKLTIGEHGSRTVAETVVFPLLESSPNSAEIIQMLNAGRVCMILEQVDNGAEDVSRWHVIGCQNGLKCPESTFSNSADSAWVVTLTGERNAVNQTWLYDTDKAGTDQLVDFLLNYEWITGLTIADGSVSSQIIFVSTNQPANTFAILPNGTVLTGAALCNEGNGYNYTGAAGAVKLLIAKTEDYIILTSESVASQLSGVLNTQLTGSIDINNCLGITGVIAANGASLTTTDCTNLTTFTAQKATTIYAASCALTAKAIGDFLYLGARVNNLTYSGTADFSGGTSALEGDINTYLTNTYGVTLTALRTQLTSWALTFAV